MDKEKKRRQSAEGYRKNREKILARQKDYKKENAKHISAQKRAYYIENNEHIRAVHDEYKANNPDKTQALAKKHNDRRRSAAAELRIKVKLHYGCQNPDCQWHGEIYPSMLEFHHIEKKSFNISGSGEHTVAELATEMRKCVVLCAMCHRLEQLKHLDATEFKRCLVDGNGYIQV